MVLLIIPGFIIAFGLAMVTYIFADGETNAMESLKKSWKMMDGHKMNYFLLNLSFIGWILLAIPTLGLIMFWVAPYMQLSMANFYETIKKEKSAK
jgi:uncharacterized membrane protein